MNQNIGEVSKFKIFGAFISSLKNFRQQINTIIPSTIAQLGFKYELKLLTKSEINNNE